MIGRKNFLMVAGVCLTGALVTGTAHALPALQLGPDPSDPNAFYDTTTETWVTTVAPGGEFHLEAFANAERKDGGKGDYAWEDAGAATQTAYLVLSVVPKTTTDDFEVEVSDDNGVLTLVDSGFGTPPIEDPNSLAPHDIFDTWYEVYQFNFDGSVEAIFDTIDGGGNGDGYVESLWINVISLADGVTGIHADLFTTQGDGSYPDPLSSDKAIVEAFAPFSHDAEAHLVPLPAAAWMGMLMLGGLGGVKKLRRRVA